MINLNRRLKKAREVLTKVNVKLIRAALASEGEEGRANLRKVPGSRREAKDPEVSEWGNPFKRNLKDLFLK